MFSPQTLTFLISFCPGRLVLSHTTIYSCACPQQRNSPHTDNSDFVNGCLRQRVNKTAQNSWNHRIVWVGKESEGSSNPWPCTEQPHRVWALSQCFLNSWCCFLFPGNPVPGSEHPLDEEFSPDVPPLTQLWAPPLGPITAQEKEEIRPAPPLPHSGVF